MEAFPKINFPSWDPGMTESMKYNHLMGRDVPKIDARDWGHFNSFVNCPNLNSGSTLYRNLPNRMEHDLFNNYFHSHETDFFNNLTDVNFRPSHPHEYYTFNHPIRVIDRDGNRELFLCFHLSGFKPSEITCTFDSKGGCIVVEANHDFKDGTEHHIIRKYYRKYKLPALLEKVDLSKGELQTFFSSDGHLHMELPLPKVNNDEMVKFPIMPGTMGIRYSNFFGNPSHWNSTPIDCKLI